MAKRDDMKVVLAAIPRVWDYIGEDSMQLADELGETMTNEAAVEGCIDANRLGAHGSAEAEAALRRLLAEYAYPELLAELANKVRLVGGRRGRARAGLPPGPCPEHNGNIPKEIAIMPTNDLTATTRRRPIDLAVVALTAAFSEVLFHVPHAALQTPEGLLRAQLLAQLELAKRGFVLAPLEVTP